MKRDDYRELYDAALEADFHGLSKPAIKELLDDWLHRALATAIASAEPFSDWEKINFRDAISASYDGLFWLARACLVKAVMPDHPAVVWPVPPAGDLDALTPAALCDAAEYLRHQPAQEKPIFMRRQV